jgi:hypothetical protein
MPPPLGALWRAAGPCVVAALLAAVLGAATSPRPARAVTSIPAEPNAIRLDGTALDAAVADIDGDGRRDLVEVVPYARDNQLMALEVIRQIPSGEWVTSSQAPLEWTTSEGPRPLVSALATDPARIVTWHDHGRERLLVFVNSGPVSGQDAGCCLTGWAVSGISDGIPEPRMVVATGRGANAVLALDMDGDGTDELVIQEPESLLQRSAISVLRWNGTAFDLQRYSPLNAGDPTQMSVLGESDGLPGQEVAFVGSFAATSALPAYGLTRISLRGGKIHVERTELTFSGRPLGVGTAAGASTPEIVLGDVNAPLVAYSWPADGSLRQLAQSTRKGQPVALLGTGKNARVVVDRGPHAGVDLLAADLDEGSATRSPASPAALAFAKSALPPYVGPWPDPMAGGATGFVAGGTLVRAPPGLPPDTRPMALLPGTVPIGTLGEAGEHVAILRLLAAPPAQGVDRQDGSLLAEQAYSISLAPTEMVLTAEADGGVLRPVTAGAVVDPRDPGGNAVFVSAAGMRATVATPPGSLAEVHVGSESTLDLLTEPDPAATTTGVFPFQIPFRYRFTKPGDETFDAALYVVTPGGHGYATTWRVKALRQPPQLRASGPLLSLLFQAEISGTTDPAATVVAEGRRATTDAQGRFRVSVPAGFVPRDVRVEASDPFGHKAVASVSVVAPLDYRQLPWIPIIAVLTLVAMAFLFLRAPRLAPRPAPRSGEGTFEEIEPGTERID